MKKVEGKNGQQRQYKQAQCKCNILVLFFQEHPKICLGKVITDDDHRERCVKCRQVRNWHGDHLGELYGSKKQDQADDHSKNSWIQQKGTQGKERMEFPGRVFLSFHQCNPISPGDDIEHSNVGRPIKSSDISKDGRLQRKGHEATVRENGRKTVDLLPFLFVIMQEDLCKQDQDQVDEDGREDGKEQSDEKCFIKVPLEAVDHDTWGNHIHDKVRHSFGLDAIDQPFSGTDVAYGDEEKKDEDLLSNGQKIIYHNKTSIVLTISNILL